MVYLITDPEQESRMVTGILIRDVGVYYYLSHGINETYHTGVEISREQNQAKKLNI